jgi:putative ABC transport system permease protein
MAISESLAKKCFADINPIGKVIATDSELNKVTLVFADLPENCHMRYDVLLSINRLKSDETPMKNLLFMPLCRTFLLMPEGYQAESFQGKVESIFSKYAGEEMESFGMSVRAWLQPLADIHLDTEVQLDSPRGNILHLYAFTAVAIFILLVVCINYMNLATARSMKRGREVGMRKVLGATRVQLITQFLGESVFFALIALVIGLVLVEATIAFTPINDLLGKQELMNLNDEPVLMLWMLGFSLVVGLISGIYPAFYLSSVPTTSTLTGITRSGKKGFRMRHALLLIQFIISIAVIASTIFMALQMRYVANKPLGFNIENQVIIRLVGADLLEKYPILKNELLKDSRILNVSRTQIPPGTGHTWRDFNLESNEGVIGKAQPIDLMIIKEDFIKTMEMELVRGRDFSSELLTDIGSSVLVNEALVKKMGWEEPLGKRIQLGETEFKVIGVVKDFHYQSLHQQIEPLIMWNVQDDYSNLHPSVRAGQSHDLVVNISKEEISKTLDYIKELLTEFDPEHPFNYYFLDDRIEQNYISEQRLMKLAGIFSGICILISCLGLFGLAAFTTEQRTKEIGIRKVLGATTFQIIVMLSRSILLIVLAASVVASLVTYWAIDEWLTDFAYHAGINPLVFVLSAVLAMTVAFGTVALQSFRTAQANPVEALRYE